ncbi:MAG: HU family DNA-binding protein [Flavobacteriales bacterium]|nr:HU family DNA-binding protein [Flavobacteriales bacterium]
MNKAELIDAIAQEAKMTKASATLALNSITENISKALASGDKVTLIGFGTFSVTQRAARKGRNPKTGAEIQIEAKGVAKFKAGSELATTVK